MDIHYSNNIRLCHAQLDALTDAVGWGVRGEERWQRILQQTTFIVTAWQNDTLAGMARTVDDGTMCMVYDVAVHPNFQGYGIGGTLMDEVKEYIQTQNFHSIGLFAWDKNPSNIAFYTKHGFNQVNFGMKLPTS